MVVVAMVAVATVACSVVRLHGIFGSNARLSRMLEHRRGAGPDMGCRALMPCGCKVDGAEDDGFS
jgi:hypothetical protein